MKIALIGFVVISIIVLLGLVLMSFKLLRKSQKEELAERQEMRKSMQYQVHPQVEEELKRLDKLKKELENKK